MINVETIKFVRMLDELAALSENGIEPFANATDSNCGDKIFYDESKPDENSCFPVVLDMCLTDHHDAISYYDSDSNEFTVRVHLEEGQDPAIDVTLLTSVEAISIHDGRWYFV